MAESEEADLELIAAFIDGRLSGDERQRALRLLAESEAAFEVYSDAVRAHEDLGTRQVVPLAAMRRRRTRLPWRTIGSIAAAAVVVIAVVPVMQARRDQAAINATSAELVDPLTRQPDARPRTLLGDAADNRGWSVTRGGSGRLVDSTIAFRLGVRAVDLQMALAQRDTLRADRMAGEIVASLDAVELSDAVKAHYVALRAGLARGNPAAQLAVSASRGEQALDELLQSFWFDFGRWVGAGELAAGVRSAEFFANARTARFLESASAGELVSERDAVVLRQIAALVRQGVTDREFETIREHFRTLIQRHGG